MDCLFRCLACHRGRLPVAFELINMQKGEQEEVLVKVTEDIEAIFKPLLLQ
jgi:hypothetical protein